MINKKTNHKQNVIIYKLISQQIKDLLDYNLKVYPPKFNYKLVVFHGIISDIEYAEERYKGSRALFINIHTWASNYNMSHPTIKQYINYLEEHNHIKIMKHSNFKQGISFTYNTTQTELLDFKKFCFEFYTLNKELNDYECTNELEQRTYDLMNNHLQIDIDSAIEDLYTKLITKEITGEQGKYALTSFYNIGIKRFYSNQSTDGCNRIYTNFANFNKKFAKYLYLDGRKLSEIDLKTSQPYLLHCLTNHIESEYHNIVTTQDIYIYMGNQLCKYMEENDIKKYTSYDGYTTISHTIEQINTNLREFAKIELCKCLFSFNKRNKNGEFRKPSLMKLTFTKQFPEISKFVESIPESSLAMKLQQLESDIFLIVYERLLNMNIKCLTKHDSIAFYKTDYNIVLTELERRFKELEYSDYRLEYIPVDDTKVYLKQVEIELIDQDTLYKVIINPETNKKIFTFSNTKSNETFVGTQQEFIIKYNHDKISISKLINNKLSHYKKWIVISS